MTTGDDMSETTKPEITNHERAQYTDMVRAGSMMEAALFQCRILDPRLHRVLRVAWDTFVNASTDHHLRRDIEETRMVFESHHFDLMVSGETMTRYMSTGDKVASKCGGSPHV